MNRTKKAILASWIIIALVTFCLVKGWVLAGFLLLLCFQAIRRPYIHDWQKTREFLALKKGRSVAFMVFALVPMVWLVFREVTMPELQSIDWEIFWVLSIPIGISTVVYERWLYLGSDRLPTARFGSHFQ
jgi:hypothetical protein